jgi:hypothetical protein
MKLTDGEKIIIYMLSEIYEALEIKGDSDPKFLREAILSGHLWAIKERFHGLLHGHEADQDIVAETRNLLSMWRSEAEISQDQTRQEKHRPACRHGHHAARTPQGADRA